MTDKEEKKDDFKWKEHPLEAKDRKKQVFEGFQKEYQMTIQVNKDTGEIDFLTLKSQRKDTFGDRVKHTWLPFKDIPLIVSKIAEYYPDMKEEMLKAIKPKKEG